MSIIRAIHLIPCHVGLVVRRTAVVFVIPEEAVVLSDYVNVRPVAGGVALKWKEFFSGGCTWAQS